MRDMKVGKLLISVSLAIVLVLSCTVKSVALGSVEIPLEVYDDNVISVVLPVTSETGESPFDFMIDPQGLIYLTDAAKYGGGDVEEGATVLFRNREGEYDFSSISDYLDVTNRSTVPVVLTVTATVVDLGRIELIDNDDFSGRDDCSMYMALVDSYGNEYRITENGEVRVSVNLDAAPANAYVYRIYDDGSGYEVAYSTDPDHIAFDSYSFGLKGACNPEGEWEKIAVHPSVKVTWQVEPIIPDKPATVADPVDERDTVSDVQDSEEDDIKEPDEAEYESDENALDDPDTDVSGNDQSSSESDGNDVSGGE